MIQGRVRGVPYPRNKKRGNVKAAPAWTDAVITQTRIFPKVTGPCHLKVTFRLPDNKFPKDHPYGSDLDNLLKRFCDALQRTIFSEAPGGDGCIVGIRARKVRASREQEVGADFKIVSSRAP
jgi:Holliday junction resolvase RusA-like endonuclease